MPPHYSLLFWNAHSLTHKLSDLKLHALAHRPLVMGVCETWLHPHLTISFHGNTIHRADRPAQQGGGLALFIHNTIASLPLPLQLFPGDVLEVLALCVLAAGLGSDPPRL